MCSSSWLSFMSRWTADLNFLTSSFAAELRHELREGVTPRWRVAARGRWARRSIRPGRVLGRHCVPPSGLGFWGFRKTAFRRPHCRNLRRPRCSGLVRAVLPGHGDRIATRLPMNGRPRGRARSAAAACPVMLEFAFDCMMTNRAACRVSSPCPPLAHRPQILARAHRDDDQIGQRHHGAALLGDGRRGVDQAVGRAFVRCTLEAFPDA